MISKSPSYIFFYKLNNFIFFFYSFYLFDHLIGITLAKSYPYRKPIKEVMVLLLPLEVVWNLKFLYNVSKLLGAIWMLNNKMMFKMS